MEVHDSRAKRQEMIMYSDFISNLPDNVIDQILVHLPILDAVRTSVLSTNWRYKWTTIPELVFHDNQLIQLPSPPNNNNNNNINDHKLINFIDRALLLHSGFIHKFELSTKCLPMISSSIIDAWILFLSRKNIKVLVLTFSAVLGRELYKLPTCFFSAQQISTLKLYCCVLKPPPTFTGFSKLKSLDLRKTIFDNRLISKCPLLERLTLIGFSGNHVINICSPNLKYLCLLFGDFQDICFENTQILSDVTIGLEGYTITDQTVQKFLRSETKNVIKVLSSLPSLGKFTVNRSFLKFLSLSKIPEKLPFTCHHLNKLTLQLNFENVNDICVSLCLLNSAPNLRQLEIREAYTESQPGHEIENFWKERIHIDWKMSRLQVVKITSYNGFEFKSGLEFIKLLLTNSPMLEMLSIRPYHIHQRLELMEPGKKDMLLLLLFQLARFKRATPKAVIEFPGFA